MTDGIRIDALNSTSLPSRNATFPVMHDGQTYRYTVEQVLAFLIASAPGDLDNLDKIAAAINSDPNYHVSVTNALDDKLDIDGDGSQLTGVKSTRLSAIKVYDLAGSPHTWSKPADLDYLVLNIIGGGGSGSGGYGTAGVGSGGGGGGVGVKRIAAADLASSETVTVGSGGASPASGDDGSAGGTTSFGAHVSATGGGGGTTGSGAGSGGTVAGADFAVDGSAGNVQSGTSGVIAGEGGSAPGYGSGGGGLAVAGAAAAGNTGITPGGGGGGGRRASSTGGPGGAGAPGRVIVFEFTKG